MCDGCNTIFFSSHEKLTPIPLWKVVSKETAFGGGEHHTNGTRVDEEDRVPTNALGGSDGQNMEGRFPMVGIGRDEKRDNRLLGQVDMIIVSFRCLGTKARE
jgi:hypothetical protein